MTLEEFIKKYGSQEKAAEILGLTQGMVSGRITRRYPMTADAALDLERRSNGEMTRYDLLPDIFGQQKEYT